ncbi:hypothetical protein [Thermomonas sp.]
MRRYPLAIMCVCLLLAACGADSTLTTQQQTGADSLPQPEAAAGSVTGMPNPGAPSLKPPPAHDPAMDTENPDVAREAGRIDAPNAPMNPPAPGNFGEIMIPPPDTMPTMPAPTPDPVESRTAAPPQS